METQANQPVHWRSAWPHIAIALLFVLLAHQALMFTPHHTDMTAMISPAQHGSIAMPCGGTCPVGIINLCVPGRVCAAVQATFARLPFAPLMLLMLLFVAVMAIRAPILAIRPERWLWPSERRRALLQVFLI